jgi:hypothetical protein
MVIVLKMIFLFLFFLVISAIIWLHFNEKKLDNSTLSCAGLKIFI